MQPRRLIVALLSIMAGVWLARSDVSPTLAQNSASLFAQAATSDWPVLVGGNPARNGLSAALGPSAPTLLWLGGTSTDYVHQAVIEGNIVVSDRTHDYTDYANGSLIEARDLLSGDLLWTAVLSGTEEHIQVMGINGGQVYATRAGNGKNNVIYALDATTGAVRWASADQIDGAYGLNFADNGDLIIGTFQSLLRIDRTSGQRTWILSRICPVDDTCGAAIFGNRGYIWETASYGPRISVVDIKAGKKLYQGSPTNGDIQQVLPFVGPDGTVYAPRTQNNPVVDYLIAYTDTGTALVEKWRSPLGYVPVASFGVGPDGSVYSYSPEYEVVRLDPATGAVINRSEPLIFDFPLIPRMAIDRAGIIYLNNGGFNKGRLYSFNPDLTERWQQEIHYSSLSGVSLADNGVLIVSGAGTDLRAYATERQTFYLPLITN